jgi:hypothetical protein
MDVMDRPKNETRVCMSRAGQRADGKGVDWWKEKERKR